MAAPEKTLLLDYALSTDPAPMPVSTTQTTSQARVNISLSAGSPVYCEKVLVAVPVGESAPSLFSDTPAWSVNTNKWNVVGRLEKGSEISPGLDPGQDYASFTYTCLDPSDYQIDYNLVFGMLGSVNEVVGDVEITIKEWTSATPKNFQPREGTFPLSKACPGFYLKNLLATAQDAPTVPATDFTNGAPIRLVWESNGTYFQLFSAGLTTPVYAGTATTCTLGDGVSRDTTFVLAASMTSSPGQDSAPGGYEPIYLYESLAVSVSDPDLAPRNVTVSDALEVTGTSTLGTTLTGPLTSAGATVNGPLEAGSLTTGGTLDVNGSATVGQATVTGGLSVDGGSTLDGATVNGTLTGTGSASLNNLTVNGLSGSAGPVSLLGTPVLFAQDTDIAQTSITSHTDGFAVVQVLYPDDVSKSSFAYGMVYNGNNWFYVTGGTVGSFGPKWADMMANNPNALTVPIQKGITWSYAGGQGDGNQLDSQIQVWWFPMGSAPNSEQTFRVLSGDELADVPPLPPLPDVSAVARGQERAATEFVDHLAQALGATLPDRTRADLAQLLRRV